MLQVLLLLIQLRLHGNAEKLGEKEASEYITIDRFAIVSSSMVGNENSESLTETVAFPEGFNNNNCVVISAMVEDASTNPGNSSTGTTFQLADFRKGALPCKVTLSKSGIQIEIRNISISNNVNPTILSAAGTFCYKIVLMRTDWK